MRAKITYNCGGSCLDHNVKPMWTTIAFCAHHDNPTRQFRQCDLRLCYMVPLSLRQALSMPRNPKKNTHIYTDTRMHNYVLTWAESDFNHLLDYDFTSSPFRSNLYKEWYQISLFLGIALANASEKKTPHKIQTIETKKKDDSDANKDGNTRVFAPLRPQFSRLT